MHSKCVQTRGQPAGPVRLPEGVLQLRDRGQWACGEAACGDDQHGGSLGDEGDRGCAQTGHHCCQQSEYPGSHALGPRLD